MHHIPNILSSFRILLIPFFALFAYRGDMVWAAVVLIVSGLTDLLDGFLARRFDWISNLGKMLDPIADKLTQITVCVFFAFRLGGWFRLFFAFLIFKEIAQLGIGMYLLGKDVKLKSADRSGKITTLLFYASMIAIALFPDLPHYAMYILLAVLCVSGLLTGLHYLSLYRRQPETVEK